jgi:hypothetical protein
MKKYIGTWHITEMEMWDEDYFNMEVQAYIEIDLRGCGHFQFGLVSGQLDGEVSTIGSEEIFDFTWDGNDECDPASGAGWLKATSPDQLEGKITFHMGDSSILKAKRVTE